MTLARTLLPAFALSISLGAAGAARAEEPPAPPLRVAASAPAQRSPERVGMMLASIEGGPAVIPGRGIGGLSRISVDLLTAPRAAHPRFVWGMRVGMEGFGGPGSGGFAVPLVAFAGAWSKHVIATVGSGFNLVSVDGIDQRMGGGLLSPRVTARLGFTFDKVYLALGGDAQRRWGWGFANYSLFSAGASVGMVLDETLR